MDPGARVIAHVDMDAFFASVEQRDNPELRGKPVLVGGSSKRGVVMAASYEARKFGCRSAMPTAQALRLCPQAIIVKGGHGKYSTISRQVFNVVRSLTPDVQPISIDEAFFDLTHVMHLHARNWRRESAWEEKNAIHALTAVGRRLKQAISDAVDLPASIGISANKFLAKVCSDLSKPDGLKILPPQDAERSLLPMPVGVIFGVGPKAQDRLRQLGVRTIAEFRAFGEVRLVSRFGEHARDWLRLARGEDNRPVHTGREQKSIGKERTFFDNIADPEELRSLLLSFVEDVARSLREDGLKTKGVTLKLRLADFRTFSRSRALEAPTDSTKEIWAAAWTLLQEWLRERKGALRLMGVSLHGLTGETQLGLFGEAPPQTPRGEAKVDSTLDAIVKKFGRGAIKRGGSLRDE